jgi:tetratricopeptide (TPR) repeat protein
MENIGHDEELAQVKKNRKRYLLIAALVLIISIPLLLLIFKKPTQKQTENTQTPTVDIATLEALTQQKPDYINLVNLSKGYIALNMPGKAIPYLKKAITLDSAKAVAYNNLGVANIMLKNLKQGIDACTKAVAIDNTWALAKNNLKWGLDEQNKVLAAISMLEAVPAAKKDITYYTQLGLNYLYIGNYDASVAACKKGLDIDRANNVLLNNMGTARVMAGSYDEAITIFNKILTADPNNQLAKNNIAWATSEKNGN